jgi:iron-sulfur cluster assembly protein
MLNSPVTVSESAIAHFTQTLKSEPDSLGIRLGVKKSGCSGFAYVIGFAKTLEDKDTVFKAGDISFAINPESLSYLAGMHIDCVEEDLGAYIKFINPNVTGECGCGESFTTE